MGTTRASVLFKRAWGFDEKNLYLINQFREQCEFKNSSERPGGS